MTTFTLTYKENQSQQMVLDLLSQREKLASENSEVFKKCCGSLAYMSLFVCPAYELRDKGIYSIEAICRNVPGFFKFDMHTLLLKLGSIACGEITLKDLESIIELTTLFECLQWLQVHPTTWLKIFVCQYLIISDKLYLMNRLNAMDTFACVSNFFEEVRKHD